MTSDLKNALRSTRDMDEYLEVRSTREIIEDIIMATASQATLSSFEELGRTYSELQKWKTAETELSNAYLRLRAMIPGALNTPHAPTQHQVWSVTEEALKRALSFSPPTRSDAAE